MGLTLLKFPGVKKKTADPKVGVKPIKRYVERMGEDDVKRAILVVQESMTAFAKTAMLEIMAAQGVTLEQFQEAELLVNITEHVLVPTHEVLTKEEKAGLLKKYRLKEAQRSLGGLPCLPLLLQRGQQLAFARLRHRFVS